MEVIFDTTNLRPVLSPTMRTTLSVISLIANSLVEANKCMKERLADEAGPPTTLDQVMQQSGLKIPGLEEALARLMGGGADAKQAASMIVNTPDPVKLVQAFATQYGSAAASPSPTPGPIVTPPPAANTWPESFMAPAPRTAQAAAPGPRLAPFRADFTREAREAAKAAAASPSSSGLPQFRQDFTPEARQAAQVHSAGPMQRSAPAQAAEPLLLIGGVARQLDAIRRNRHSFEGVVHGRLMNIEMELARLRAEFDQLRADLLNAVPKSAGEAATATQPAATPDNSVEAAPATVHQTTVVSNADTEGTVADVVAEQPTDASTVEPRSDAHADEPLPPAATAEEVVQAIGMIEEFAVETHAAEQAQLARIAAAEQEIIRMRGLIQSVREARGAVPAHV